MVVGGREGRQSEASPMKERVRKTGVTVLLGVVEGEQTGQEKALPAHQTGCELEATVRVQAGVGEGANGV